MRHEQAFARMVEGDFFDSSQPRQALQRAAAAGDPIDIVGIWRIGIAQHIEPAAVRRQQRVRYFECAAGQRPCRGVRRLGIQMRISGFLGLIPQRAIVVEPTELIERALDPRGVAQAMFRDQLILVRSPRWRSSDPCCPSKTAGWRAPLPSAAPGHPAGSRRPHCRPRSSRRAAFCASLPPGCAASAGGCARAFSSRTAFKGSSKMPGSLSMASGCAV